jgi:hypothetical protein
MPIPLPGNTMLRFFIPLVLIAQFSYGASVKRDTKNPKKESAALPQTEEINLNLSPIQDAPDTGKFEELKFEKSFVIEAKVERPQVQFPLLKEAPPEKPIPFEVSFRDQLLKVTRENTFRVK